MGPSADELPKFTDKYFLKTREIVRRFGDVDATYAVFMRRPVLCTPKLALDWLLEIGRARGAEFAVELCFQEGDWVGAGEPLLYISGPLGQLVDLETVFLQKLGPPCVAAFNAFLMCTDLPYVGFIAMDARHCAGAEMAEMMAYAASVGSAKARREANARGFIGNATDATAHYFGNERGLGTMPHALIGYAGSTLRAAEMFHETFPDDPLYVLVDYFGKEIADSLEVCRAFSDLAQSGAPRHPPGHPWRPLRRGSRYRGIVRGARAPLPRGHPHLSHGDGAALAGRHRRHRRGDLPSARAAGRGRLRPGQDHRQLRVRSAQVQADGERARPDRLHRHGLVPARTVERDLRHGRRDRVQRRLCGSRSAASSCSRSVRKQRNSKEMRCDRCPPGRTRP